MRFASTWNSRAGRRCGMRYNRYLDAKIAKGGWMEWMDKAIAGRQAGRLSRREEVVLAGLLAVLCCACLRDFSAAACSKAVEEFPLCCG
jgi:hypothetical protein